MTQNFGLTALAIAAAIGAGATAASAADLYKPTVAPAQATLVPAASASSFFIHAGVAGVFFSPGAYITAGGAGVPNAGIKAAPNVAATADIGYYFLPNWSASLTVANPPTVNVKATGSLAAVGKLGSTTYLPPILAVQYHFTQFGAFQPYIGAGVNYTWMISNSDSALNNFRVRSNVGFALQAGTEYMIDNHWGVYADVKHVWLRTTAAGNLGGAPVTAKVTLDPTIVSAGVAYRF